GRYGAGGAQVRAGYEIAIEQINAAGGVSVGGKKVPLELTLLDDESDATKTVSRMETLAAQGIVAYLGGFGSDLHAAAASVAAKNNSPYSGVAFALFQIPQRGFKYLFSPLWTSPHVQGRERGGGVRPAHAARRNDDRQADAGARLQPKDDHAHPRARPADLVEEPRQGRRLRRARAGLAPRGEGARRQRAERGAPE